MQLTHPVEKRLEFLNGGGEIGSLIRSLNWSGSPLGPPEQWPQSLRTTLNILLNSNFPMFLFWGPDHICFYNDAYRESLGNNEKHPAAIGRKGIEVWPEIWDFINPLIKEALNTGKASWREDQLLHIYRNEIMEDVYWTFSYSPVNDDSGRPAGVFVTCVETTEQVKTIKRLIESEIRFHNIVDQATVGVVVLQGPDLIVSVVNERYCQLIHKLYSEVIGKPIFQVIPEADHQFSFVIDEVRSSGITKYLYDYPFYIYLNGEFQHIYTNLACQPYRETDGSIRGVLVLVHDVTEQMRNRKEIEYAEERARLAIDSAELGVYELDLIADEIITDARFNNIFGFDRKAERRQYIDVMHPEDLHIRNKAYEEAQASGNLMYEIRVVWKDGSLHWIKVAGRIFKNHQGVPIKLLGVVQDVTDQKLFSEELAKQVKDRTRDLSKTNQELQKINDELEQYVHVSSHDLQEPVRKIRVYADLIMNRDYDALSQTSKNYFDKIRNAAERLGLSLKDLLNFNSLSEVGYMLPVDLNELVSAVETDLELMIEQKEAVIRRGLLPVINGVAFQLHQLFYNLINNALKFSKKTIIPEVSISASRLTEEEIEAIGDLEPGRQYHEIIIKDNGIGFDEQNAEKIFTIFQRLHNKEDYMGTGIGLALCKKAAVNHGGKLWARSSKGDGASFHVVLPE